MTSLLLALAFFSLAVFGQSVWIRLMRYFELGELIKPYGPGGHEKKIGTPGMGGTVALALIPLIAAVLASLGVASPGELLKIWGCPAACAAIGLLDDCLKRVSRSSEGLRSLQKLFIQIAIMLPWAYATAGSGLYITREICFPGIIGVPLLAFIGVGFMNAVNVTDGLDGLAAGCVAISLCAFLLAARSGAGSISAAAALGVATAFLWHNANPAQLFMGDVGAHLWAGLLLSLCVNERALILIFPLGFMFGVEILTVAIQIVAIRRFKTKVFLMSPLHHHFELLGWGETKIVARFWLAHLVGMAALAALIMAAFGRGVFNV